MGFADSADYRSGVVLGGEGAPGGHATSCASTAALTKPGPQPKTHTNTETNPYLWQRGMVQWGPSITERSSAGRPRAAAGPRFYAAPSMPNP